jgi:glycosyltransferase involved in cell wall biosynthesis
VDILFVLPRPIGPEQSSHVTLVTPDTPRAHKRGKPGGKAAASGLTVLAVNAMLSPYASQAEHQTIVQRLVHPDALWPGESPGQAGRTPTAASRPAGGSQGTAVVGAGGMYSGDMFAEVDRYAGLVVQLCQDEDFDVVHAHDWMTYPAGIAVAGLTGKPLVVHVHSTEFDRSGEHVNQRIYDIERRGMEQAAHVVAVSHLTRHLIMKRYGIADQRITVIYNAIDQNGFSGTAQLPARIERDDKIVLFLGRITMQKGPEYFLAAAKRVLELVDNVRFVMAGSGDMIRRTIELAAEMGIGHRVLFTGFLSGPDVARIYRMADLYVMPSVSEPFGIAPLEALSHDVPVIISKQSGVAEVLTHVLKVDFWDIDEMANKMVAVLRHPPLQSTLREHAPFELRKLSWRDSAQKCADVYRHVLAGVRAGR